jgi:hypothetical protein
VKVDLKGDAKVVTKNGEEYLQVNNIKTKIQVGDSAIKVAVKDDTSGALSECTYYFTLCDGGNSEHGCLLGWKAPCRLV